jgi:hypothetical protein
VSNKSRPAEVDLALGGEFQAQVGLLLPTGVPRTIGSAARGTLEHEKKALPKWPFGSDSCPPGQGSRATQTREDLLPPNPVALSRVVDQQLDNRCPRCREPIQDEREVIYTVVVKIEVKGQMDGKVFVRGGVDDLGLGTRRNRYETRSV